MKNLLTILSLFASLLLLTVSCGDSIKRLNTDAKESYRMQEYGEALNLYEKALTVENNSAENLYKAGFSAMQLRRYDLAEKYFGQIDDLEKRGSYSDTDYQMGLVQKGLANYSIAISYFRTFIRGQKDGSDILYNQALKQIESCEWAIKQLREAGPMTIVNLGTHVNSENDELAPLLYADKLYFTTQTVVKDAKPGGNKIHSAIQQQDNSIDKATPNNTDFQVSNISLNASARRMYFTICKTEGSLFGKDCEIFYRDRTYEGEWERHKKLPAFINVRGYNTTQPAIGYDKFLRKEVLYFVSDRPGGKGKMDIWVSVIEGTDNFGEPFPLPFNSEGNDVTPFFHSSSQTLFFSSDGNGGMGGFDVFRASRTLTGKWENAENLGYPLNSSYDEIYYSLHSKAKKAHFSSNRPGSVFNDAHLNRLSYDIYMAEINVEFVAQVYNSSDSSALKGVKLELINLIGKELDAALANASGNSFRLPLDLENTYAIAASLQGYLSDTVRVTTRGQNRSITYERDIYLRPEMNLLVRLYNAEDKKPLAAGTVMVTNEEGSHSWVMDSPPKSNEVTFNLEKGKQFIIKGHSKGFYMMTVNTGKYKLDDNGKMTVDLFLLPVRPVP